VITVLFDGIAYGMLLFLMAVGLSVTLGLMNFVNLAHGGFAMVGGYAASLAMERHGIGFLPALGLAFGAAAAVGAVLEVLLYRRLYRSGPLDQVLLTIGIVFVSIAVFTRLFGPAMQPFVLPPWLDGRVVLGGLEVVRYRLFLVACGLAVLVALLLGLGRTRYGAMVRAAVDNRRVAAGLGLPVGRLFLLTFALGSGLAGLGGALGLGLLALDPYFALRHLAVVLMVVCVGGAGSVAGPFVAAMGVGIVDVAGRYWLPQAGSVPVYATLVAVLLWKPQGLARRRNGA
jgi:branched-chain amino acid transport system permease protein